MSFGLVGLGQLANHWLEDWASLDVAPPGGDGIVNFRDFAVSAEYWPIKRVAEKGY